MKTASSGSEVRYAGKNDKCASCLTRICTRIYYLRDQRERQGPIEVGDRTFMKSVEIGTRRAPRDA